MALRTPQQLLQPRAIRTDAELREASFHVWYECEMLKYADTMRRQNVHPGGLSFAVPMESFLTHARNLNQFFYGVERWLENHGRVYPEDIIVEDFFVSSAAWQKPLQYRIPETDHQRMHVQLAHLSYDRVRSHQHSWNFEDILTRLTTVFGCFVKDAPRPRLCPEILATLPGPMYRPRS